MFTVLFALLSIIIFLGTMLVSKLNIKLSILAALGTVLVGFIMDTLIVTYFVSLTHLIP